MTFISSWQNYLNSEEAQNIVPNFSQEIDNLTTYYKELPLQDNFKDSTCGEREEWMFLAELNSSSHPSTDDNEICPDYWRTDLQHYNTEDIGNMPTWIQQQKENSLTDNSLSNTRVIDVTLLNENQRLAHDLVVQHHNRTVDNEQLFLIVTGLAGSGKSYVVDAIRNLLQERCKIAAYFGVAAFNVHGQTLHSLLHLPIRGKRCCEMKGHALSRLQEELSNISEQFRTILTNLHNGDSTMDDWHMLLSRTPNHVLNLESFKKESVKLSYGNEKVAQDNFKSLKELGQPAANVNAKHNNSTASKLSADNM